MLSFKKSAEWLLENFEILSQDNLKEILQSYFEIIANEADKLDYPNDYKHSYSEADCKLLNKIVETVNCGVINRNYYLHNVFCDNMHILNNSNSSKILSLMNPKHLIYLTEYEVSSDEIDFVNSLDNENKYELVHSWWVKHLTNVEFIPKAFLSNDASFAKKLPSASDEQDVRIHWGDKFERLLLGDLCIEYDLSECTLSKPLADELIENLKQICIEFSNGLGRKYFENLISQKSYDKFYIPTNLPYLQITNVNGEIVTDFTDEFVVAKFELIGNFDDIEFVEAVRFHRPLYAKMFSDVYIIDGMYFYKKEYYEKIVQANTEAISGEIRMLEIEASHLEVSIKISHNYIRGYVLEVCRKNGTTLRLGAGLTVSCDYMDYETAHQELMGVGKF